jgi:transposase
MSRLEEINDVKTLQQVASHLEKTTIRQSKKIARLRAENARLKGEHADPQMELKLLKEQLAAMQREVFGESSERRPREVKLDDDESKASRRGHGPKSQPNLPVEEVTHTLEEDDRPCPICGETLVEMGDQSEESEEITVVGVEYKILKHRRQKYRCRCNEQVMTAPGPAKHIPGGRYSVDFAVHVAEDKYLDHLPLERQVKRMGRAGLEVDSQTLWDQINVLARILEPTYVALCKMVLELGMVYADETSWRNHENSNTSKWWTWCVATDNIATYRILNSRSQKAAKKVLSGFEGIAMTDGYTAYQSLARSSSNFELAHCWAHVRRKFLEAADFNRDLSEQAVRLINTLFAIEREVPRAGPDATDEEKQRILELRRRVRQERSKPVIKELLEWAGKHDGAVLPRSKLGKAITYMLKLWKGLTLFLEDPRIPLDNNAAERALRGVVVGRKNHYGSKSKRGTEVAALFYTLFETAKLSGVDPRAYVTLAANRAIADHGAVTLPSDLT